MLSFGRVIGVWMRPIIVWSVGDGERLTGSYNALALINLIVNFGHLTIRVWYLLGTRNVIYVIGSLCRQLDR